MEGIPWVGSLEVGTEAGQQGFRLIHHEEDEGLVIDDPSQRLQKLPSTGFALQVLELILYEAVGKALNARQGADKITIHDVVLWSRSRNDESRRTTQQEYEAAAGLVEGCVSDLRRVLKDAKLIETLSGNYRRHGRYRWRGPTPILKLEPIRKKKRKVEFESLGNNHEGMVELLRRFEAPDLVCVHEVHSRMRPESIKADYSGLPTAFGKFLDTCDSSHPATFIFGRCVDPRYVEAIHTTIMKRRQKGLNVTVECRILNASFPLMNFVVLEYASTAGKENEVLFGWGQGYSKGAVFASKDADLIAEFMNFLSSLLLSSEPVAVEELPEKLIHPNSPRPMPDQ